MEAQGLQSVLIERLEDSQLDEDVQLLILAAFEGDDELAQALEGAAGPGKRTEVPPPETVDREAAYLRSISVRGFRGVGPEASLQLQPGPGLTLVVGRNGSGKSSFAEAAEVALTGDSYRWQGRSKIWRNGWRNLHTADASQVAVGLAEDGQPGTTSVVRRWHGSDVGDSQCSVQRPGQPRGDLSSLGWERDLATYRPFLSYSELGRMLDSRPSDMYDALAGILGLERLATAEERLKRTRKELNDEAKTVKDELATVKEELAASDDPRAREAEAALRGRKPDLDRAAALAAGDSSGEQPPELDDLRRMSGLGGTDEQQAMDTAAELRQAIAADASFRGTDADEARRLAELLDRALGHYQRHACEGACPVCGTADVLDHDWSERTGAEAQRLQRIATDAERARSHLARATDAARRLFTEPPVGCPPTLRYAKRGRAGGQGRGSKTRRSLHSIWSRPPRCCGRRAKRPGTPRPTGWRASRTAGSRWRSSSARGWDAPVRSRRRAPRWRTSRQGTTGCGTPRGSCGTIGCARSRRSPRKCGASCAKRATLIWARSSSPGPGRNAGSASTSPSTVPTPTRSE